MGKGFKTKGSISKRFKITGTGRVRIKKLAGRSHFLAKKSPKRKRQLKSRPMLGHTNARKIKQMINM
jgi:large subunit ribosomal protein L35